MPHHDPDAPPPPLKLLLLKLLLDEPLLPLLLPNKYTHPFNIAEAITAKKAIMINLLGLIIKKINQ